MLQKSLRRKEIDNVLTSTHQLLCCGKTQLQWHSLLTFLFEDHCLAPPKVIHNLARFYKENKKLHFIELLLKTHTCRVNACLPVVALDMTVPDNITNTGIDSRFTDLVDPQPGHLKMEVILSLLVQTWRKYLQKVKELQSGSGSELGDVSEPMILYMKLLTMVQDESRSLTSKGKDMLLQYVKKPNIAQLTLSILYKNTPADDQELLLYLKNCFILAGKFITCVDHLLLR